MSTTVEEFETKVRRESIAQSISFKIDYDKINFGKELGSGGSGIVYQGDFAHGVVAIKQLLSNSLSPEARKEFHAESQMMAGLHAPHIVQFYGYCLSPKYCIVMEYMPRGSLYNLLQNTEQPLDWPTRIRIATDVASGLAFLHQKNILHRDIKSLNILLTESLGAKLTDFGLSKVKNETKTHLLTTKAKDFVSTIAWMAPELFKHGTSYTKKSDIYSLGITLWEIATRKTPFSGADPTLVRKWVKKGTRERDEIPVDCPQKLTTLIEACWAASPDERPNADMIAIYLKSEENDFAQFLSSNKDNLSPVLPDLNLQVNFPASPHHSSTLATSNITPKRRDSNILNLTDTKEEKEKLRTVLEALRQFFSEEREDGEKTENYTLYNEYLKKAHNDARLDYKTKQNKHVLYVNDEALDAEAAAKEISKMLKSLAATTAPQKPIASPPLQPVVDQSSTPVTPEAPSPVAAPIPKPNVPEQKTPPGPAMLTQLKNWVAKPAPVVNASELKDLQEFLRLVAEGEQDKVETMLKSNLALALVPGDVTDLSKRTFTGITAFQYAVWALDWHMWTMIRKYLPPEEAQRQAQGFETGSWVENHGIHANLNILIQAYETADDLYHASKYNEGNTAWVRQVGGAQLLLPAHIINEYCHPTRPFYPVPNFKKAAVLPRSRTIDEGEWFTASYKGGKLGDTFGYFRGSGRAAVGRGVGSAFEWLRFGGKSLCSRDLKSVILLAGTRTAQREELIAELRPRGAQRLAA
ncbi:MAG TPA: protein kinase [Gammaproteobacteria bacterium]|nr:protein kinase [Gammaproteobacteria bacterium]HQZ88243.1 protein kinase [Gammaproteobacteria bacterium]